MRRSSLLPLLLSSSSTTSLFISQELPQQRCHSSSSSSATTTTTKTKLKVDPMTSDGSSNPYVQRNASDAALRKTARISSSLPRFGTKAKQEEKKRKIEEIKRQMEMMEEEEEFLNMTSRKKKSNNNNDNDNDNISKINNTSSFHSEEDLQKAEEDAWKKVSEKYGFATKPAFIPNYRAFLFELQKYEMQVKVLSAAEKIVMGFEFLKNDSINHSSNNNNDYHEKWNENNFKILESLVTDTTEANSFGTILLYTQNCLEALHFGKGVSDLKRVGQTLIPFAVPAIHHSRQHRQTNKNDSNNNNNPPTFYDDPDDVSTFKPSSNIGFENIETSNNNNNNNNNKSSVQFLNFECKMHPDTPNSVLFPPNREGASSTAIVDGAILSRWAVMTIERDDTEEKLIKMMSSSSSSSSYRSSLLLDDDDNSHNNKNDDKYANNNKNLILSVSLSTWTYMVLSSLVSMLNRNDVGVANYELLSSLHSSKDVEPAWHKLRKLNGMHESPWPIDPRLLWYPGKKF